MQVTSRQRLAVADALAGTRKGGRTIAILIPTLTECTEDGCGFDENHDSAIDPSCSSCDGLGRTATWAVSNILANIRFVDNALKSFGTVPPGAEVGDFVISYSIRDKAMVEQCLNEKDAYISLEGKRHRPVSINSAGIGQIEEYVSVVKAFSPIFTKAGY